jgi:hypothetical protein
MGTVSYRADFNVAATAASNRILAATASSRASRPEFQHSSPSFGPGTLAATVGTSSWRTSPTVRNASVDDTDSKTYLCLSIVTFAI